MDAVVDKDKGDFGGAEVGVTAGYGTFRGGACGAEDPEDYSLGLTIGVGGFSAGASWASADDSSADGDAYNLGVAYSTGPFGVSLSYFHGEVDDSSEQDTFHLSGKYALGPGVTAAATLGHATFEDNGTAGDDEIEATYLVTGIRLSF